VGVHVVEAGNDEATLAFDESSPASDPHNAAVHHLDDFSVSDDYGAIPCQLSGADVDDDHVVEHEAGANSLGLRVVGAPGHERDEQTERFDAVWSQV